MSPADSPRAKNFVLALLAMAQFVVVLDASIVNVALPSIGRALDISQESLSWVVNAYVLTFGGFLLLGGRLADLLGRRRVFMAGLILFAAASLAGGLADSEAMLIAARAVQGLGAAILSPAALSIVTTTFREGADRNKALGIWGAVAGSGGAAGVLLGGVLTEYFGREWVLFVNVPIGVIAAALAPGLIGESRDEELERSFDVAGALSVTAGLSLLVYALVDASDAGWDSTQTLGLLALSVVLLVVFVVVELRARVPLVPFATFRRRTLTGSNVTALMLGAALFSMFFFISLYMQQVLGFDALEAGLAYLPLAITIILAAGAASALVTRLGFSFVPVTIGSQIGVGEDDAGLASGLINTAQQIGGALGLAVLATVATSATNDAMEQARGARAALPGALTDGFSAAFLVGAGFAVLGILAAVTLIRERDAREAAPGAEVATEG